jgi:hypothetical protein
MNATLGIAFLKYTTRNRDQPPHHHGFFSGHDGNKEAAEPLCAGDGVGDGVDRQ